MWFDWHRSRRKPGIVWGDLVAAAGAIGMSVDLVQSSCCVSPNKCHRCCFQDKEYFLDIAGDGFAVASGKEVGMRKCSFIGRGFVDCRQIPQRLCACFVVLNVRCHARNTDLATWCTSFFACFGI